MRLRTEASASSLSRKPFYAKLLTAAVPLGLVWRLAPLHLPPFAFKYGGSALWAAAVYGVVGLLAPEPLSPARTAAAAAWVAVGVEAFKKLYWPPLDRFRETLAGKLLLGRYFTWGAIVAYLVAILAVLAVEHGLARRGRAEARREPGVAP